MQTQTNGIPCDGFEPTDISLHIELVRRFENIHFPHIWHRLTTAD